jgi:tRNA modification GTPase
VYNKRMKFVHRPYQPEETIAAVATAPGEGGIAVIRISGKEACDITAKIYSGPIATYPTHTAHFGKILDAGEVVDEVLLLVMRAPRSYTGEETVEIHCHGGSLITKRVLETVLKAGARAALPGEFTFRAFKNGKIDLAQAEAVQELIAARNDLAMQAAERQLDGALSRQVVQFQKELTGVAAIVEAWIDFPEEGLEFATVAEIVEQLEKVRSAIDRLAASFHEGKVVRAGLTLCLLGAPNVGKSSLMNALLGKERAIVTDIAGTTRDLLEDEVRLGGLHFRLLDTAGVRKTEEVVEKEGIRRTKQAVQEADFVLLILDASRGLTEEDLALLEMTQEKKRLVVYNKIDLQEPERMEGCVYISAKERMGLDGLKEKIEQLIWRKGPPSKEELFITNVRHKEALQNAEKALAQLISGLKAGVSPEFLSSDMRLALSELGTIIGTDITEDILSAIFSKFCVGK